MAKKNQLTTCSPIAWDSLQEVLKTLKEDGNYRFMLLIAIGMYMGLRIRDILHLKWSVLLERDILELKESKTGKPRRITVNPNLRQIIAESYRSLNENVQIAAKDSYVFINREGIKPISIQYVNRTLHKIFNRCQIVSRKSPSSHALRKSFARKIFEQHGCSDAGLILISALFNHNNSSVTRRYIGLEEQQFADVYMNL